MKSAFFQPARVAAFVAFASASVLLASGPALADALPAQTAVISQPSSATVSRAQVQADFLVWQAAGMEKWSREGADLQSPAYAQDMANYSAVRASPQFALVQSALERGQMPVVNMARNPLRLTVAAR